MLARVIGLLIGLWFDVGAARDLDATLQLRVKMLGRGVPLRLRVSDGRCVVTPGPAPEAGAQVAIGLADLIRVAFGLLGWPSLLSSGRLELSGDPFLALRFPALFKLRAVRSAARGPA